MGCFSWIEFVDICASFALEVGDVSLAEFSRVSGIVVWCGGIRRYGRGTVDEWGGWWCIWLGWRSELLGLCRAK